MVLHIHLVDPLYGFQCLSVKTILGLYIAHYAYGPLFPEGEV